MLEEKDAFEQGVAILVTGSGFFLGHFLEEVDGGVGDIGLCLAGVGEWFLDVLEHDVGDVGAAKRDGACEDLKKDDAKGVDIGAVIERFAGGLFGGEIVRAADDDPGLGIGHILVSANESEVGKGDLSASVNDQVRGFDIAVDESGIMGDFETEGDLFDHREGLEFGEAFVGAQELIDVFAVKEFHDDVKDAVFGGSCVEDLYDVRAL